VVLVSPNYRLADPVAQALLDAPFIESWGTLVAGAERGFEPHSADQAAWWTTSYPTAALYPMAALMRHVRALDPGTAQVPALFVIAPDDRVVDAATAAGWAAGWRPPAAVFQPALTAADDPWAHVIAGRIMSPGQTAPVVAAILDWARNL
jgi:hypothetical protein